MKNTNWVCLFLLTLVSSCSVEYKKESKPNIIFLFTDDQTYKCIQALGNEVIYTPYMDRLVQNGTTFTHAYNMGAWSGAVCAASRAMMISGRSVWRANQFRQNWLQGKETEKTWSKLMEQAGYDTYMSGKWHVDVPADKIFQEVKHVRPGMPSDHWNHAEMVRQFEDIVDKKKGEPKDIMPVGYNRPLDKNDASWSPSDSTSGGFWEGGTHWSEVLKEDALMFIDKASQKENPFFMYLAFNAPHDPRQSPQKFLDLYPLDKISIPPNWQAVYPFQEDIGNGPRLRDEALAPFPRTVHATKKHIQEYYAIISHLDEQIGQIIDALEDGGQLNNTYIFFTSDHGLAMGSHGLLGKQNLYDHSIRVPLLVSGPNIPKNQKISTDIYLQDIMATCLDIAAVEKPNYIEFKSFLDLAKGETAKEHYEAIYGCYKDLQRMIRKENFKLILYPAIKKALLFDMVNDPNESNNLAIEPKYQQKIVELYNELRRLQKKMDAPLVLEPLHSYLTEEKTNDE